MFSMVLVTAALGALLLSGTSFAGQGWTPYGKITWIAAHPDGVSFGLTTYKSGSCLLHNNGSSPQNTAATIRPNLNNADAMVSLLYMFKATDETVRVYCSADGDVNQVTNQ